MQISSQGLLPSLTAQIAATVAQAADKISSTISESGTNGSASAVGTTPTSARIANSSAASTLSSNTLGALIQQTQTDQESSGPTPLDTSGPTSPVAFTLSAQAQALDNSVIAASDGGAGSGVTQFDVAFNSYVATRNASNSPQTDLKTFESGLEGAGITLTQAQIKAAENWATSSSDQAQT